MIKLYTDTDTDITLEEARKLGIVLISMPYTIDEKETYPYEDYEEFKDIHTINSLIFCVLRSQSQHATFATTLGEYRGKLDARRRFEQILFELLFGRFSPSDEQRSMVYQCIV